MAQKTQKANGVTNLDGVNVSEKVSEKILLSSLDKHFQKRILQKPYQVKMVKNLTNNQKIELQQSLLIRICNGDEAAKEEAQMLQGLENEVQVPVKGITGLEFLIEELRYIQTHKIDDILRKVSEDCFEAGSEEKRVVGYYLETGMIISANPTMIKESKESEESEESTDEKAE